jgi:hypothetical protein
MMTLEMNNPDRIVIKYPLFASAITRIQACYDSFGSFAEPLCCPIVGESGGGKTTIITHFASMHHRIDHACGTEVPVLLAKVPSRPTVKSLADTLLHALGDPLWYRGNTVSKSIRLRELFKRCHVRLLALDEFQHFVDVRRASIPNEVADWLKEQVEEARLPIVVLGLERCLEVLRQNEQLRRRFGATVRVGAFRWDRNDERTTYRAFLRAVQEQLSDYEMPILSEVEMAFRMYHASYGLVGYTMKIIRGAAQIAARRKDRKISLGVLSDSFAEHVWAERMGGPNPFAENFDSSTAPPVKVPGAEPPQQITRHQRHLIELHA